MKLPFIPVYSYTGPQPFSDYGNLPYAERYILDLMVGIRSAESVAGDTVTAFWTYALNGPPWQLSRATISEYSTIEYPGSGMPLVWSVEKTYGFAELSASHHHGTHPGALTDVYTAIPFETDFDGKGKTFGGMFIDQIRIALESWLTRQGLSMSWWLHVYKEIVEKGDHDEPAWYNFGVIRREADGNRYNLTTDHVEYLRFQPRSILNAASNIGVPFQFDARLTQSGSGKAAIRGGELSGAGRIPDGAVVAVIERRPVFNSVVTLTPTEIVDWADGVERRQTWPSGIVPVDGSIPGWVNVDFPLNTYMFVLSGGAMSVLEQTDGPLNAWILDGTYPITEPPNTVIRNGPDDVVVGPERPFGYTLTGLDAVSDIKFDMKENAAYWTQFRLMYAVAADRFTVIGFDEAFDRFVTLNSQPAIGGGALTGVTIERPDGGSPEGPVWNWRVIASTTTGCVGVDLVPSGVAETELWVKSGDLRPHVIPTSVFHRDDGGRAVGVMPIRPGWAFRLDWTGAPEGLSLVWRVLEHTATGTRHHALWTDGIVVVDGIRRYVGINEPPDDGGLRVWHVIHDFPDDVGMFSVPGEYDGTDPNVQWVFPIEPTTATESWFPRNVDLTYNGSTFPHVIRQWSISNTSGPTPKFQMLATYEHVDISPPPDSETIDILTYTGTPGELALDDAFMFPQWQGETFVYMGTGWAIQRYGTFSGYWETRSTLQDRLDGGFPATLYNDIRGVNWHTGMSLYAGEFGRFVGGIGITADEFGRDGFMFDLDNAVPCFTMLDSEQGFAWFGLGT